MDKEKSTSGWSRTLSGHRKRAQVVGAERYADIEKSTSGWSRTLCGHRKEYKWLEPNSGQGKEHKWLKSIIIWTKNSYSTDE